jgi:hypothetical protein
MDNIKSIKPSNYIEVTVDENHPCVHSYDLDTYFVLNNSFNFLFQDYDMFEDVEAEEILKKVNQNEEYFLYKINLKDKNEKVIFLGSKDLNTKCIFDF